MPTCVEAEVGVVIVIGLERPPFSGGDGYINPTLPRGSNTASHFEVASCRMFEVN